MSLGEILTQETIDEESLSEATNCDPMPASSNESEKPSVPLQILLSERVLKQVKDLLNLLAIKKGRQLC